MRRPTVPLGAGYIYVLGNPAMPGLYKIGSTRDVAARLKGLSIGTMVPGTFSLEAFYKSDDPQALERKIHEYLIDFRYSGSREFFKINLHRLRRNIRVFIDAGGSSWPRTTAFRDPWYDVDVPRFCTALQKEITKVKAVGTSEDNFHHLSNDFEVVIDEFERKTSQRQIDAKFEVLMKDTDALVYTDIFSEFGNVHFGTVLNVGQFLEGANGPLLLPRMRTSIAVVDLICERVTEFEQKMLKTWNAGRAADAPRLLTVLDSSGGSILPETAAQAKKGRKSSKGRLYFLLEQKATE